MVFYCDFEIELGKKSDLKALVLDGSRQLMRYHSRA